MVDDEEGVAGEGLLAGAVVGWAHDRNPVLAGGVEIAAEEGVRTGSVVEVVGADLGEELVARGGVGSDFDPVDIEHTGECVEARSVLLSWISSRILSADQPRGGKYFF